MKRAFIAGPISLGGTASEECSTRYRQNFATTAEHLRSLGCSVENPLEQPEGVDTSHYSWSDWMRLTIGRLMLCDTIVLLPDWEKSKGARLEAMIAGELGMSFVYAPIETSGTRDRFPLTWAEALHQMVTHGATCEPDDGTGKRYQHVEGIWRLWYQFGLGDWTWVQILMHFTTPQQQQLTECKWRIAEKL